jgi:Dolichyl-phosphate-mannose-protein mannosyltransferase
VALQPALRDVWNAYAAAVDFQPPLFVYVTRFSWLLPGRNELALRMPQILGVILFSWCLFFFVGKRLGLIFGLSAMILPLVTNLVFYAGQAPVQIDPREEDVQGGEEAARYSIFAIAGIAVPAILVFDAVAPNRRVASLMPLLISVSLFGFDQRYQEFSRDVSNLCQTPATAYNQGCASRWIGFSVRQAAMRIGSNVRDGENAAAITEYRIRRPIVRNSAVRTGVHRRSCCWMTGDSASANESQAAAILTNPILCVRKLVLQDADS